MANGPYFVNGGTSKPGRDLLEATERLGLEFARLDVMRQAMIQQTDHPYGPLSTRTDNTQGVLTLGADHGLVVGQIFDVFWSGGQRVGVTAADVSANVVQFAWGTGDDLPPQDTVVTVSHYKTVAQVFKYNTGDGTSLSPNLAYAGFSELASMINVCQAALTQFVARMKQ